MTEYERDEAGHHPLFAADELQYFDDQEWRRGITKAPHDPPPRPRLFRRIVRSVMRLVA